MTTNNERATLLEVFLHELDSLNERLEELAIEAEAAKGFSDEAVDELFRIMHTIKGSSAAMMFNATENLAHRAEDLFSKIRDNKGLSYSIESITEILFDAVDYIKAASASIRQGEEEPSPEAVVSKIGAALAGLEGSAAAAGDEHALGDFIPSGKYIARVKFEEGAGMENIRAFSVIFSLQQMAQNISFHPADLDSDAGKMELTKNGLLVSFDSDLPEDELNEFFDSIIMKKEHSLKLNTGEEKKEPEKDPEKAPQKHPSNGAAQGTGKLSIISVSTEKLDTLLDLMGEIVILEAMLAKCPGTEENEAFQNHMGRLVKITDEIKDAVMSLRMVPMSMSFNRLNRVVRDMNKSLGKNTVLEVFGGDIEVDKNIIENLSDPLIHLVRNSIDHGIESESERLTMGKPPQGALQITAVNTGGDVIITISDDGRGLDRGKILSKAAKMGLLTKPADEMSDDEVYALLFTPGFSTKEQATHYSGRGVGLDVVKSNVEKVGGNISVSSVKGEGTTFTLKIPLTLAIIDGLGILANGALFTLPVLSVLETFMPRRENIITGTNGAEMVLLRGECYPLVRLSDFYGLEGARRALEEGIIIVIAQGEKKLCLFADELIGEQQVVIKPMPSYMRKFAVKEKGISGCTVLNDGSLSFILDAGVIIDNVI